MRKSEHLVSFTFWTKHLAHPFYVTCGFLSRSTLKEACYSRVPVGISLHVNGFTILADPEVHFMVK